ncbi:phage N-6-adenine-methyltransferase [Methylorubrum suomiense]|uniref:Adenine methyltransferase n=1 Tax=Methylorubrum suomiense TaxID=144191 RepID=A0ABQ4UU70_9HYPH|nr:phage N-6-adenine-methyltransferase [Methylorubrum suomiense]GJE75545.1 hypothetical protein BGCPKDLD_2129 [Methylorubrum suomiense]
MGYWDTPGQSDEWYTPPAVFGALGCRFDLDVAPARFGQDHVPADERLHGDGLAALWGGFVWMNPPFGGRNGIAPWLDRFFDHGDGIALTPDRTSAPWFWRAWVRADLVLFTRKIRFLRPDGSEGVSPSNGTALWAVGGRGCFALRQASSAGFGILATPAGGALVANRLSDPTPPRSLTHTQGA